MVKQGVNESFEDFQKRCPEKAAKFLKDAEAREEKELLEEAKRLKTKQLTLAQLNEFLKKKYAKTVIENQHLEIKKKLSPFSEEIRNVFLENLFGLSILEQVGQIDVLIRLYHKLQRPEKIGQSEKRNDWPEKIDEARKQEILDEQFRDAMSN